RIGPAEAALFLIALSREGHTPPVIPEAAQRLSGTQQARPSRCCCSQLNVRELRGPGSSRYRATAGMTNLEGETETPAAVARGGSLEGTGRGGFRLDFRAVFDRLFGQDGQALRRDVGEAALDLEHPAGGAVDHHHVADLQRGHERRVPGEDAEVAF